MTRRPASGFVLARMMTGSEGIFEMEKKKPVNKKQHSGTKLQTSEIKMVWREEHKRQDQKSKRDPLNFAPLAVRSWPSTTADTTWSTWCWGIVVTSFLF